MAIIFVFLFAFIIRLIHLNQSLWLDEAIVAKVAMTVPFHLIPFQFSPADVHPPLYYLTISLWTQLFGTSEIALRFPSILFSLIAGVFVYKIGLLLRNRKTALWATIFFLFNPLIVYYSQEARMHMMATMFLTITLYYFTIIIKEINIPGSKITLKNIFLFNLFSAFSLVTFYGSAFFIAAMIFVVFVLPKLTLVHKVQTAMFLSIGVVVSLSLISPLLVQQLLNAKAGLADLKNWNVALGKAELKNFAMIFLKFVTGRVSWYPKLSFYITTGIPTLFIWAQILLHSKKNRLLIILFSIPLLLGYLVSFVAPMMQYFRFLYLVPLMSIALAEKHTRYDQYAKLLSSAIFIIFSLLYLLNPQFHREDWKNLSQSIDIRKPVYIVISASDPVAYYAPHASLFELKSLGRAILPEHIQVVPYIEELYGISHAQILEKEGVQE